MREVMVPLAMRLSCSRRTGSRGLGSDRIWVKVLDRSARSRMCRSSWIASFSFSSAFRDEVRASKSCSMNLIASAGRWMSCDEVPVGCDLPISEQLDLDFMEPVQASGGRQDRSQDVADQVEVGLQEGEVLRRNPGAADEHELAQWLAAGEDREVEPDAIRG